MCEKSNCPDPLEVGEYKKRWYGKYDRHHDGCCRLHPIHCLRKTRLCLFDPLDIGDRDCNALGWVSLRSADETVIRDDRHNKHDRAAVRPSDAHGTLFAFSDKFWP